MTRGLHWFRQDLRLRDNSALVALASRVDEFLPVFVLDPRLIDRGASSARAQFLLAALEALAADLAGRGIPLLVRKGRPERVLSKLARETGASVVSWNRGGTPFAHARDAAVHRALEKASVQGIEVQDHNVYAADEVRTKTGGPFAVYTPYRNAWWRRFAEDPRDPVARTRLPAAIGGFEADAVPKPREPRSLPTASEAAARKRLRAFLDTAVGSYVEDRDRPDRDGTSRLSPYLRFGLVSVRECFRAALAAEADDARKSKGVRKWLDELIWRDFYAAILSEHPRVLRSNHRRAYDALVWRNDPAEFAAWCEGRTGFPFVDAGMRQLAETGWMHNRVRMIVASFLTKDLLVDWRWGERFFFDALVDGDPASNNGGWQWAASTGTDAQPYFRIFNPTAQGERWDPDGRYVKRYVPELQDLASAQVHEPWRKGDPGVGYPKPMVDHKARREAALAAYKRARALAAAEE